MKKTYFIEHEYAENNAKEYKTLKNACMAMWEKRTCFFGTTECAYILHDGVWNFPSVCNYASLDEYMTACKEFAKIH